ncbi:hypothetical protein MO867_01710 [Microbulbifer sp. OS29]|uniref:Cytochrome oxidase Cu insertion factor, SCO1/SenC/PrrC family n=1 Tax=Microbulbifer okhotskensis TaxID=2926617 RepID=A0A9X2J635_9GAMM|nr:hypothetical protein [Microbulbifer okhotskensis]MCO1333046.1 hypothetical protein [Microbulbifer okhotskensis]
MKNSIHSTPPEKNVKKTLFGGRKIQSISIIASVVLPIVAAYIVFYTGIGMPNNTANQGELLQPAFDINTIKIIKHGEELPIITRNSAKWRYLILSDRDCGKDCEDLLYISRQVHIRLGDKANRVERVLVVSEMLDSKRQKQLQIEHPKLKIVSLNSNTFLELLENTDNDRVALTKTILVDQEGFAMMAYDSQHSGNQLLKDIKRLLKYSYEK